MKLAMIDIRQLSPDTYAAAYARMSTQRQAQCDRLASQQARLLCVAADMAARQLADDWHKDQNGKPVCENGFLSLAHSGDYALAVHSNRPVGIDIEKIRPLSPALCARLGEGDPLTEWVKKEAYGKALGVGVYRVLDTPIPDGWDLSFPAAPEGYLIAICEKKPSISG